MKHLAATVGLTFGESRVRSMQMNIHYLKHRADLLERRLCIYMNYISRPLLVRNFFRLVSRLGDGVFWYALILLLPYLNHDQGFYQAGHIILTAILALLLYKSLKNRMVRERPFINCEIIQQAAPVLDYYSFPSGHTLHAFLFSIMLSYYLPQITVLAWIFTGLVALSRVVLGLHYPTDVFAGALLGSTLSLLSLILLA